MFVSGKGAQRRLFYCPSDGDARCLITGLIPGLLLGLLGGMLLSPAAQADGTGTVRCPAHAPPQSAQVRYVHDGDTVHLADGRKVRLIGINTPEVARDDKPAEAYAADARNALRELLQREGNAVGLVYGEEPEDRYGRTLAHLFTPAGRNLQAALLERGLALAVAFPPNTRYADCYREAERHARCGEENLWSSDGYAAAEAGRLADDTRGFRRVSGKVTRVTRTGKDIRLLLDDAVLIGVRSENLDQFDPNALFSLEGQNLTVRGWVNPRTPKKNRPARHYIRIRHSSAIEDATACD